MILNSPSKPMVSHYCDIFTDCYHCPCPYCPYEKLDDGSYSGWGDDEEELEDGENEEDTDWH